MDNPPESQNPQSVDVPPSVVVRPKKNKKRSTGRWVALGALAVGIALVGSTMSGSAFVYSKYVDEIVTPTERARWVGRTVRLEGLISPASIRNLPGTNEYLFRVNRNHAEVQVHFRGVVPDTFADCAGVTVRGVLQSGGGFEADEVVAKCPSKYEAATVVNGQCVIGATGSAPPARL